MHPDSRHTRGNRVLPRPPRGSRQSVHRRRHCRRACGRHVVRIGQGRMPPGVRRMLHVPATRLRPAVAGRGYQRQPGSIRHLLWRRMGHERRDPPGILRRSHDYRHPRNKIPGADQYGGISRHARLGDRADRHPSSSPHPRRESGSRHTPRSNRLFRHRLSKGKGWR